jgi:hypothetical protein
VFIQAADTYLHVAIEAVGMTQAQTQPSLSHSYSRGLAPWCLNRRTTGSISNPNYWSCGLRALNSSLPALDTANATEFDAIKLRYSNIDTSVDYIDVDGNLTAILAPKEVPAGFDYSASSFGVSMQCQPVQDSSCIRDTSNVTSNMTKIANFNCSDAGLGIHLSGAIYPTISQIYEIDLHRLFQGPPPFTAFENTWKVTRDMMNSAANLSDADASNMFHNPWRLFSAANLWYGDEQSFNSDNRIFNINKFYQSMFGCNATGM